MHAPLRLALLGSSNHFFFSSFFFFWSPEFHELWYSVMSFGLFTEIKRQWATGMGDRFCALLVSQMALQLALVD